MEGRLMAVEISDVPEFPQSTGAVPFDGSPVTVEQVPGHPESSGAVDGPPAAVETTFGALGTEPTSVSPNPEPVTVDGPFAKVVRPQGRRAAEPAATTGTTKAQQPASQGDALPGVGH